MIVKHKTDLASSVHLALNPQYQFLFEVTLSGFDWRGYPFVVYILAYWIDNYAKTGGLGEVRLFCSFHHDALCTSIKTTVNKFAISNHATLILGVHALRSYLKLICEYETHSLPNEKASGAKDHGKNCIKVRPPLVCHLLRNRLFFYQVSYASLYVLCIFNGF